MPLWVPAGLRLCSWGNLRYREGVLEYGAGLFSPLHTLSPGILASAGAVALSDLGTSVGTIAPPGGCGTAVGVWSSHGPVHWVSSTVL